MYIMSLAINLNQSECGFKGIIIHIESDLRYLWCDGRALPWTGRCVCLAAVYVATIGAIAKEAGKAWAAFVAFWSTSVAYSCAVLFYQVAQFSEHPVSAAITIGLIIPYALLLFIALRSYAGRSQQRAVVAG